MLYTEFTQAAIIDVKRHTIVYPEGLKELQMRLWRSFMYLPLHRLQHWSTIAQTFLIMATQDYT